MEIIIKATIGALIAKVIWDLFLLDVCSKIRHNNWLNSKISNLKKKVGREFLHKLFTINKMKGRGRSPEFSEYTESFWQTSYAYPVNISIKVEGKKKFFKRVCRVEFTPKECLLPKHSLRITTLDSNGEEKEPITLNMSLDERKQFAEKMYYIFVLYHKKWAKQ